jgi:hypothetical protein
VLPDDLPRLDLGTGLGRDALADLLAQVASVTDEQASARDLSLDTSVLGWVIDVLAENPQRQATVAAVTAGLRALAQAGDPRDDVAAGLITAGQADRLTAMFGRAATERVVLERAWILEAQLRKLAPIGSALTPLPRSALRVVALGRRVGAVGSRVLATYLSVALTHLLRERADRHRAPLRALPAHRDGRSVRDGHHQQRLHQHHGVGGLDRHLVVGERGPVPQYRARPQRQRAAAVADQCLAQRPDR